MFCAQETFRENASPNRTDSADQEFPQLISNTSRQGCGIPARSAGPAPVLGHGGIDPKIAAAITAIG
jgi:hypothetical protein